VPAIAGDPVLCREISGLRICVTLELPRSATAAACSTPSSLSEMYRQPRGRPLLPRPQLPLLRPSGAS
jgi:hypothetical protein